MGAIKRIIEKLSNYPGVKFGRLGKRLEIGAANDGGFPLAFVEEKHGYRVWFGPCPLHFQDENEALDHVAV